MPLPGTDGILSEIRDRLEDASGEGKKSVSQLVTEVRNSIKGPGDPSLRSTILALEAAMHTDTAAIIAALGRGGGGGGGGDGGGRGGGNSSGLEEIEKTLSETVAALERAVVIFEGIGHGEGKKGENGPRPYWETEIYLSATKAAGDLIEEGVSVSSALTKFNELNEKQNAAIGKDLLGSVLSLSLNTTNLSTQFRNLHGVLGKQITDLSTSGIFGSNALGPMEALLEGPKRYMDGILTESDSFRTALRLAQKSLSEDLTSPLVLTGRDLTEVSQDLFKARQNLRDVGTDTRGWMSTDEANKTLEDMLDSQHKMGIQSLFTDNITRDNTRQEIELLKVVASMTTLTTIKIEEQIKKQMDANMAMVGLGRMTDRESINAANVKTAVQDLHPETKAIFDALERMMGYGRTATDIKANAPADFTQLFATQPRMMERLIQLQEERTRENRVGETAAQRNESFMRMATPIASDLQNWHAQGRENAAWQTGVTGSESPMVTGLYNAAKKLEARVEPDANLAARSGDNATFTAYGLIKEKWQQMVEPFIGLPTALAGNIAALWANTGALSLLVTRGIFGGGLMGGALGAITGAARGLGMAGGATAIGVEGYQNVQQIRHGEAGAGYGGLAGAGAGMAIGAGLGTLTDWFTGPFGTILGGVIGQQIGTYVGGMISPAQSAVAGPHGDMVGPGASSVSGGGPASTGDDSLTKLSEISDFSQSTYDILGKIATELSMQTGLLRQDNSAGSSSSSPIPQQSSISTVGRSDIGGSYPGGS